MLSSEYVIKSKIINNVIDYYTFVQCIYALLHLLLPKIIILLWKKDTAETDSM